MIWCVQISLAYLTAATHGLDEEAEQLQQQLEAAGQPMPTVNPSAIFLQPPPPIAQAEFNWPLLTVSKVCRGIIYRETCIFNYFHSRDEQGFFDGAMAARTIALNSAVAVADDGGVADGWGDDADLDLDGEEKPVGIHWQC